MFKESGVFGERQSKKAKEYEPQELVSPKISQKIKIAKQETQTELNLLSEMIADNKTFTEVQAQIKKIKDLVSKEELAMQEALSLFVFDDRFINKDEAIKIFTKDSIRKILKHKIFDMIYAQEENDFRSFLGSQLRLSLDINGLKSINDYTGHENGDVFLERVVRKIIQIQEAEVDADFKKFLQEKQLSLTASSEGGDEFGFMVEKDGGVFNQEDIDTLASFIQKEIEAIPLADLVDLQDEKTKKSVQKLDLPADFKFRASMAIGSVVFKEAFDKSLSNTNAVLKQLNQIITDCHDEDCLKNAEQEASEKIANIIMGYIFDLSDQRMYENKKEYKEKLRISSNKNDQALYRFLQRQAS